MEINRFTFLGVMAFLAGLGLLIFQAISTAMNQGGEWTTLLLSTITGDAIAEWIEKIPLQILQDWGNYLAYELPFYQLLLALGGIFIVLGMIFND